VLRGFQTEHFIESTDIITVVSEKGFEVEILFGEIFNGNIDFRLQR
jgi:hypothetical protein